MRRICKKFICGFMALNLGVGQLYLGGMEIPSYAASVPGQPLYKATVDLEISGGTLLLSSGAEVTKPWNAVSDTVNGKQISLIPGKTVLVDSAGDVLQSSVTIAQQLDTGQTYPAAKGLKMSGDILGVKSYFLFEGEIVCIGAGVEKGTGAPAGDVVQVLDNVPIVEGKTRTALSNPSIGERIITTAIKDTKLEWSTMIDAPVKGKHTRNWIYSSHRTAEEIKSGMEWSYIFHDNITNSNLYYKFNTYEDSSGTPLRYESWLKPKADKTYGYTLSAEVPKTDFTNVVSYSAKSKVLSNTESMQAACNTASGELAVNKWDGTKQTLINPVMEITLQQPLSLALKQDTDAQTTTLTVSKPASGAEELIEIILKAPDSKLLSVSNPQALKSSTFGKEAYLKLDTSKMTAPLVITLEKAPETKDYHVNNNYKIGIDLNKEAFTGTTVINPYQTVDNYFDDYWENINLNRLPGTTVVDSPDVVKPGDGQTAARAATDSMWVGGHTALDGGAVKGIELTGGDVTGKKSYMMFEDKIVCLGAALSKEPGVEGNLITVLDNTKIQGQTTTGLVMSYTNQKINKWLTGTPPWVLGTIYGYKDGGPAIVNDNSWIFIQDGSTKGLGYYFPKGNMKDLKCRMVETDSAGGDKKMYYELWLNHGASDNISYEYVILPGRGKAGDVQAYYTKPETAVLVNTDKIQAVYDTKSQTVAANFWDMAGGSVQDGRISDITVKEKASVMVTEKGGELSVSVSDPEAGNSGYIHVEVDRKWHSAIELSPGITVDSNQDKIMLTVDVSGMDGKNYTAKFNTMPQDAASDEITLVRGEQTRLQVPADFTSPVTWTNCFLKPDGTAVNMVGYSKYKRELVGEEKEGLREAGPADASHLASTEILGSDGFSSLITGRQKGTLSVVATDKNGKEKVWTIKVLYDSPELLPVAEPGDYAKIRAAWRKNIVGTDLSATEAGRAALKNIETEAEKKWNSYQYKGQSSCSGLPWPEDLGASGNPDIKFQDDAVEFRSVVKNTMAMAKAYGAEGSKYYKDPRMLADMKNILTWFSVECYAPKSQTDNWWNWEIGLPKDLVPLLMLISEELTEEELTLYCRAMRFFQPDPFYEGAINFASTHAQGLRQNEGANLIDCSVAAMGMGALLEDNEDVYLAALATSGQYIINQVEDSTTISAKGYSSGFYEDGSYLDHSYMPYTGSYGIEFYRGGVSIASMLSGTPWEYGAETMENLERYVLEGFHTSVYRGHMLDNLKGRSVSRPSGDGRSAARDTMGLIIKMLNSGSFSPEAEETVKSNLKNWLETDPGYIETLKDASMLAIRSTAEDILNDPFIDSEVPPLHKNMAFMDRAIHRTDNYLFALSMYSARIQNCEVTNGENLYGWHQGDGATYLYNDDYEHYVKNYWSTVNPYRLAGTTVVPIYIGNSTPDSSGYYQEGDYRSKEHWVGGSQIGNYGINGMSLSGDITAQKVTYAPDLRAKKSYFMIGDEIVCLGAGIKNSGQDIPVETTVENRRLREDASNRVIVDGEEVGLVPVQNDLEGIVDGTENTEGIRIENPEWAYLEGNISGSGIGYYFPKKDQNINVRKTENTGDWSLVGTSEGEAKERYFEMWFDHGMNPEKESYEYAILPGKMPEDLETYAKNPTFTVLSNTDKIQAVYNRNTKITGINFWNGGKESVAQVSSDKAASVMLQEAEDGTLTIAVSDPTMRNTKTIMLEIDRPIQSILSSDPNVEAEITDTGKLRILVDTKGTNGRSSYIEVVPEASISPEAVTVQPGEVVEFKVNDYTGNAGSYSWSVSGNQTYCSPLTRISDYGVLTVDEKETNGSLTVRAITEGGITLTALVDLGGDLEVTVPDDIKKVYIRFDKAMELAKEGDLESTDVVAAIKDAVEAMSDASNEDLREYSMDKVVKLEELYTQMMEANGRDIGIHVEVGEDLNKVLPVMDVEGLGLNIPSLDKATASNAIAVVTAVDAPVKNKKSRGTIRAAKASPSNADNITDTASPSNARAADAYSANEIKLILESGKTIYLEVGVYLEDEEGNRALVESLKAPLAMVFGLPDDMGEDKTVEAYLIPKQDGGERDDLRVSVNEEQNVMKMTLLTSGCLAISYAEKVGEPDKPEEPDKPDKPVLPEDSGYDSSDSGDDDEVQGKWIRNSTGWRFRQPDGSNMKNARLFWKGDWYYLDSKGYMETGWVSVSDRWYWLEEDGRMAKGKWVLYKECWYYLGADGGMLASQWLRFKDKWYYLGVQGEMLANQKTPDGFLLGEDGAWRQ